MRCANWCGLIFQEEGGGEGVINVLFIAVSFIFFHNLFYYHNLKQRETKIRGKEG